MYFYVVSCSDPSLGDKCEWCVCLSQCLGSWNWVIKQECRVRVLLSNFFMHFLSVCNRSRPRIKHLVRTLAKLLKHHANSITHFSTAHAACSINVQCDHGAISFFLCFHMRLVCACENWEWKPFSPFSRVWCFSCWKSIIWSTNNRVKYDAHSSTP